MSSMAGTYKQYVSIKPYINTCLMAYYILLSTHKRLWFHITLIYLSINHVTPIHMKTNNYPPAQFEPPPAETHTAKFHCFDAISWGWIWVKLLGLLPLLLP